MNKYLTLICFALLGGVTAHAQTQKGNQLLGGSVYLSTSKGNTDYTGYSPYNNTSYTGTTKYNGFGIGPNYSFFIADNLDLGASASYFNQKQTNSYTPINNFQQIKSTSNGFSASVFLRKYFLYNEKIGIRTGPFAQYIYNKTEIKYQDPATGNTSNANRDISAGIGLDLVYFPTRRLGLATALGSLAYTHSDNKQGYVNQYNSHDTGNSFGLNVIGSGLTLSVFYALGK